MIMKKKMEIPRATPTKITIISTVLIFGLLLQTSESAMDRDRGSKRSANLDLMDHSFHHEDELFGHPGGIVGSDQDSHLHPQGACEPIKVGLCMGIGYNHTTMPNLVGHDAQADADTLLQTFSPLIQYGCSPHLKLFLCSAYVPMCTDKVPQPIGPCRSLCESVKGKCEPVLKEFGFVWPPSLECSKFVPENNHEHMCNPGPTQPYGGSSSSSRGDSFHSSDYGKSRSGGGMDIYSPPIYTDPHQPPTSHSGGSGGRAGDHSSSGGTRNRVPSQYQPQPLPGVSYNPSGVGGIRSGSGPSEARNSGGVGGTFFGGSSTGKSVTSVGGGSDGFLGHKSQKECTGPRKIWARGSCWLKCSLDHISSSPSADDLSSLFHPSEQTFARNYAVLWAVLSLSAASIALTLSVCSPRFSVAERPILYLALCQVLFSIGVIIGSTSTVSCFVDKSTGGNLLAKGGMIPSSCALVFLLTFFFGTATTMWWVILCLSWLLSLNRDTASSLLQKESSLFHLVSWGVASVLTSTALVHKKVDADELTGICGVGFQDMEALSLYNLIPLSISLSLGLLFLGVGIVARLFFPDWVLPLCKLRFPSRKSPTAGPNRMMAGCELSNNSAATTTASHQTGQTNPHVGLNGRGPPHGYSPVLVLPNQSSHHHHLPGPNGYLHHGGGYPGANGFPHLHHSHPHTCYPPCMGSNNSGSGAGGPSCGGMMGAHGANGGMNNNNSHFYSTGNSPASVVGIGGMQRLRALENTKAIWMRIGIFALVHSLPIACQVGTMAYELSGREDWESGKERPNLQIFLLRLNMNLIAGLTTGVWVLSTYSWKSLSTFTRRFCTCIVFPRNQKSHHPLEQKVVGGGMPLPPVNSVVAPLLPPPPPTNLPPIPLPSGSSSSSNANHNSTMPILGSNNTFTTRGALAPHNMTSGTNGIAHRSHFNYPLPPVPPRNPDHIAQHQQRTDAWRRGETIV